MCLLSRRGNSTNQKDYKTLSARLCKCFHSYKIHFCSQFVLYIHQIGRFYIGWMDNINSSPSLIETTLFISKTLGNVYVFSPTDKLEKSSKTFYENPWIVDLVHSRPIHLWSFEDLNWILSESNQKKATKKVPKKANWQELHKCCDNVAWTSSSLILEQGFRHTK